MSDSEREKALRLAAESGFDWRTALRWLRHEAVKRGTAKSLERAAEKLGIERQREAS